MKHNKKKSSNGLVIIILKIISFIPLPLYPFVVLANVMSLASNRSSNATSYLILSTYTFLIFSTLYPIPFLYSLLFNKNRKISIGLLPLIHLAISVLLLLNWLNAEQYQKITEHNRVDGSAPNQKAECTSHATVPHDKLWVNQAGQSIRRFTKL